MTKVVVNPNLPFFDRDSFLTPFDKMFDQMIEQQFPNVVQQVGVKPYQGTAYPKVNVYEYDDKIGLIAEIPGLKKKQLVGQHLEIVSQSFGQTFCRMGLKKNPYQKRADLD